MKRYFFLLPLVLILLQSVGYLLLTPAQADLQVHEFHCALDDAIPFCEWMIFPYIAWYLYYAGTLLFLLFANRRDFTHTAWAIFACAAVSMLVALILPNGIPISMRPDFDALGRDNIAIWLVKWIYAHDSPPRTVMPSMHTSISVVLAVRMFCNQATKHLRGVQIGCCILSILIILSTVMVKQHSILDVIAGIATAAIVCTVTALLERKQKQ